MIGATGSAYWQSQALRRTMSLPEVPLWQQLRRRGIGHKSRKEHPAGRFTLDFSCSAARLCVEIDGEAHERGDRPKRDAFRDVWLAERGVDALRVPAREVLRDLDAVVRMIVAGALERARLHPRPAAGGPPPQTEPGEE
ncbi:very-short-patch-repair endonuclease [Sphingomonas insulae]|nr:DUF559 domain-containing protein [Sphingomonas insulae]NIJ29680.1 very-short-patch-repair endonuclease [Sphingomonas insulae]